MMYPYMVLSDETEISHSQLLGTTENPEVEVHFERATEDGFDSARCVLPSYQWKYNHGYTNEEIHFFEEFLRHNAHLIIKYAEIGGIQIA